MVYGGDPMLAAHWAHHYLQIGVPSAQIRLWIDNDAVSGWRKTLEVFVGVGIPASNVTVLASNWTTAKAVSGDKLNMRGKLGMVNRAIDTLPSNAAIMIADSDEFFQFPCDMEDRMQGAGRPVHPQTVGFIAPTKIVPAVQDSSNQSWRSGMFCGNMRERVAANGRVLPLRATPSIAEQFPHYCQLRRMLGRPTEPMTRTHKVVLFEKEVRPLTLQYKSSSYHCCSYRRIASSHHVERWSNGRQSSPELCSLLGPFPHYMMHQQAMHLLRAKTMLNNAYVTHKYKRLLKFMEMHPSDGDASMQQHWLCNDSISRPPPRAALSAATKAVVKLR